MSESLNTSLEAPIQKTELTGEQLDLICDKMTEGAMRAEHSTGTVIDDVALLLDALESMGIKLEDVPDSQVAVLEKVEDSLFAQYLKDEDPEEN